MRLMRRKVYLRMGFSISKTPLATLLGFILLTTACAQEPKLNEAEKIVPLQNQKKMMKVEIWSDVMCPFCYIGKRKFEAALKEFEHRDDVIVEWKSYQLNPDLITDPKKNTIQHLAESKGWSMDYTKQTISYVMEMAQGVGLNYNFEKAVVANSFDAHRVIQFAKTKGKGDMMEEALFKAYFIEGKNTVDHLTLKTLATQAGLDANEVENVLKSNDYAEAVKRDVYEAEQIGVTGVPFFVIDRKYAVSGAQDSKVFLDSLNKAYSTAARAE